MITDTKTLNEGGFTLVELSIVLVILGLLIGGVLTGQSLIRAAELRSISSENQRYLTAVQTFRDKYFALPGDMNNAQSYWGIANATPATCITTASTTALTCNGDGNGQITWNAAPGSNESFRFWQHLANAGLIEGSYDGITHGATAYSATKANSPSGRISGTIWHLRYWGTQTGYNILFDGQYDHTFTYGTPTTDNWNFGFVLKPEEAYNIDTKTDDGKPAVGKIVVVSTMNGAATSCTDAASQSVITANYQLTVASNACGLAFRQQF